MSRTIRVTRLLACLALAVFTCARGVEGQQRPPSEGELRSGLRTELRGGTGQFYNVHAAGRQFLEFRVQQTGAAIGLSLYDENGAVLVNVSSSNGPFAAESLYWFSDTPATYRLGVRSTNPDAAPAHIEIKFKRRKAGNNETLVVQAQRLYTEAEILVAKGTEVDNQEAKAKYAQAISALETTGYTSLEAEILDRFARAFLTTSEFDEVLKLEDRAFALARKFHNKDIQEQSLLSIAEADLGLARYHDAAARVRQAAKIHGHSPNRYLQAKIYYGTAGPLIYEAKYSEALTYLNRALGLYRDLKLTAATEDPLADLGLCYEYLGQLGTSMNYLQEALQVAATSDNRSALRYLHETIGYVYQQQGDYASALTSLQESVRLSVLAGDRRIAMIAREELAYSYRLLGELDKALEEYSSALAESRDLHDKPGEFGALDGMGACYREQGRLQDAIATMSDALKMAQELGDRQSEASVLSALALAYSAASRSTDAQSALEKSLAIHRELKSRAGEGLALSNLSSTYLAGGQPQRAIAEAARALPVIRETSQLPEQGRVLDVLMRAYEAAGQASTAIFFGKEAVNVIQGLRANVAPLGVTARRDFLAANAATYRKLADLLVSQGRLAEAEQVMDLLKEREFIDFLRGEDLDTASTELAFSPREAEAVSGYREIENRLVAIGTARAALIAKPKLTQAETQQLDGLDRDLEVGNRAYQTFLDGLSKNFEGVSASAGRVEQLRDTQALMEDLRDLPAGTVIVYTLVGKERFREILITPDVQKAYEYPIGAAELSKKVFQFRELVQNPDYDPRPLGKDLYEILVRPLIRDLRAANTHTVMWALDAGLRYLPLAALYDGQKYFIEQYDSAVFTPASYARFKDRPSAEWTAAGFGVTKDHPGEPALPFVADELQGIISDHNGAHGILRGEISLDEHFNKPSLRAALLKRYPVLHIASHFRFIPGNDLDSFLLLGDGSHLTLSDLKNQPSIFGGLQLLTLSACNTGVGDEGATGSEVEGLGVLAQRRGAKAVIASLWPVADSSTSLLMQEFYRIREGSNGITKAEAMRQAQLELLRGSAPVTAPAGSAFVMTTKNSFPARKIEPLADRDLTGSTRFQALPQAPYAHPFFWAPFFLMGNWL